MSAKQLLPDQCVPLHYFYGPSDCCLCHSNAETILLKHQIEELERQLAEAQGKLEAVDEAIKDNTSAASGVRHEVRASYMNPPHTTVDVTTCRDDCPRCTLDRILSKEGNE